MQVNCQRFIKKFMNFSAPNLVSPSDTSTVMKFK